MIIQTSVDSERDTYNLHNKLLHLVLSDSLSRHVGGLVQVHPGPSSKTQGATEMWCGYNRFLLTNSKASQVLPEEHRTKEIGRVTIPARMLPPTWEESSNGSPFLPPYPVAILKSEDVEDKHKAAPRLALCKLDEHFQTPAVDVPHSSSYLKTSDPERYYSPIEGPKDASTSQKTTRVSVPKQLLGKHNLQRRFLLLMNHVTFSFTVACTKGFLAPNTEKKEHNRKGYLLRQARKMMRENGATLTAATSVSNVQAAQGPRDVVTIYNYDETPAPTGRQARKRHHLERQ